MGRTFQKWGVALVDGIKKGSVTYKCLCLGWGGVSVSLGLPTTRGLASFLPPTHHTDMLNYIHFLEAPILSLDLSIAKTL